MSSTLLKFFRNAALAGFLAGCGGGEPIPVDLTKASEPCEYGQEFMTDGMMMVMKDGHVTVVPKEEGQVQAYYSWYTDPKGNTTTSTGGCESCH